MCTATRFASGSFSTVGGLYCTFDAFSGLDVRVEIHPGSNPAAQDYAVDTQGHRYPTTEKMWRGAFLSNAFRLLSLPACYIPCLNYRDFVFSKLERRFLAWAGEFIAAEARLAHAIPWELDTIDPRDVEVVQRIMHKYFFQYGRLEDAIRFFTPLLSARPVVAISLSSAYQARCGSEADAITVLLRSLKRDPLCVDLLLAQVRVRGRVNGMNRAS